MKTENWLPYTFIKELRYIFYDIKFDFLIKYSKVNDSFIKEWYKKRHAIHLVRTKNTSIPENDFIIGLEKEINRKLIKVKKKNYSLDSKIVLNLNKIIDFLNEKNPIGTSLKNKSNENVDIIQENYQSLIKEYKGFLLEKESEIRKLQDKIRDQDLEIIKIIQVKEKEINTLTEEKNKTNIIVKEYEKKSAKHIKELAEKEDSIKKREVTINEIEKQIKEREVELKVKQDELEKRENELSKENPYKLTLNQRLMFFDILRIEEIFLFDKFSTKKNIQSDLIRILDGSYNGTFYNNANHYPIWKDKKSIKYDKTSFNYNDFNQVKKLLLKLNKGDIVDKIERALKFQ